MLDHVIRVPAARKRRRVRVRVPDGGVEFVSDRVIVVPGSVVPPSLDGLFFSDSFESGDRTKTENNFAWGSHVNCSVSTENPRTGTYSLRFFYAGNTDLTADAWSEQRFSLGAQYTEFYVEYYLYVPSNFTHRTPVGSGNNKGLITYWSGSYGNSNSNVWVSSENWPDGSGNSEPSLYLGYDGNNLGHSNWTFQLDSLRDPEDTGQWLRINAHIKLTTSDGAADGYVGVWRDGTLILEGTGLDMYADVRGNYIDQGYLLGWSNSGFDADTIFYIDDIRFSTTDLL